MICERTQCEPTMSMTSDPGWDFLRLVEEPTSRRTARAKAKTQRRKNGLLRRIEILTMAAAALVAIAALGWSGISWWKATEQATTPAAGYAAVTVANGDTLWSIAERNSPSSQLVGDRLIQIRAANPNLQGQTLVPGQTVLVPVATPMTTDHLHLAQALPARHSF